MTSLGKGASAPRIALPLSIGVPAIDPAHELILDIRPHGHVCWLGTAAQLCAEGLIPKGCPWPETGGQHNWEAGEFHFSLRHYRPPGIKGSRRLWANSDYWQLCRIRTEDRHDAYRKARIYEMALALERERAFNTPPSRAQWRRYMEALEDEAFQGFLGVATERKAGRRR